MKHCLIKLKIILKYKYFIVFVIICLLSIVRINLINKSQYSGKEKEFIGVVKSYKYKEDYTTFIIKGRELIKCNYYKKIYLKYGDKIYIKGNLKKPNNNTIFNNFNYKKYLNNNDIYYILDVNYIKVLKPTNNLIYKIKNIIQNRINIIDKKGYLYAFILGNKNNIDDTVYNNYYKNGIIHIFSISGMHISLLSTILLIILNKVYKNKYNILIVVLFLIFYLVLTDYQPSIVRSIVFYILLNILKLKKVNISTNNILLLSISFILLIKPNYLFNIGFIYSSLISYTLISYHSKLNKNYLINLLLISSISFIVSFPITSSINYNVNLLSIIINILFVPLISFIIYPLSLLTIIFPYLYIFFEFLINFIEYISNILSNINFFSIHIPKLNVIYIVVYYIIVFLLLYKNKKYLILLLIMIILLKNINIIDNNYYIYYLDVGQGDMEVIKHKNKIAVIDIGPSVFNKTYKPSDNYIKFFKSIGINKINYLIFTHGDYDHMGEAINLVNNFKVEKVIFNCGPYNDLEKELIKVLGEKHIKYYSCIKELNIDKNKLHFLQTKEYDNENDNSNVIYTEFNGYKFMFMGDASITIEKEILDKYNLLDIDVLKVGHHGSRTSSSKEFIDEINPKYSIISVGKNNRYGHPNKEVLENLDKSKIYRTDEDGSIMFKIKNNRLKIETCSP